MTEVNCGKLIELLSQFPKDKPVRILALGTDECGIEESISEVGYPCTNYDDECDEQGNIIWVAEDEWVGIFTKEYTDNMLMNGV